MPVDNTDYLDPDRYFGDACRDEDEEPEGSAPEDPPDEPDFGSLYEETPEASGNPEDPAYDSPEADFAYDAWRERQMFGTR